MIPVISEDGPFRAETYYSQSLASFDKSYYAGFSM